MQGSESLVNVHVFEETVEPIDDAALSRLAPLGRESLLNEGRPRLDSWQLGLLQHRQRPRQLPFFIRAETENVGVADLSLFFWFSIPLGVVLDSVYAVVQELLFLLNQILVFQLFAQLGIQSARVARFLLSFP